MKFKDFMDLYDNWNGIVCVNDDHLHPIVISTTHKIMDCIPMLSFYTYTTDAIERDMVNDNAKYEKLFNMEVVAFGFYDNELCVRVR